MLEKVLLVCGIGALIVAAMSSDQARRKKLIVLGVALPVAALLIAGAKTLSAVECTKTPLITG